MDRGFLAKLLERIQRVQPGDVQNYLVELAREKGFLETIFNAILEGVIVTDPKGFIIYLNKAACSFFGIEEMQSVVGRPISEAIRGLDCEELLGASEVISREVEVFYPQNRLLNFYVVSIMSEESKPELRGIEGRAIILRDITETRRTAEEIIESERFSAVTLLAAGIAHEIGNPLNSLGIHLQLMQRKIGRLAQALREPLERSLDIARQEVVRLDQIITQFLQAVRPQSLNLRLESLNKLVEESVEFFQPEIRDRDVLVELELEKTLPLMRLDPGQIKQAFYNVIRNSIQAMKSGGILRIQTKVDENYLFVSFADTGGGIGAAQISHIFEPYFTTKKGGSGMGLMIVQRVVRAHGGEVRIHSTEGKGVTVSIRLPRIDKMVRFLEAGSDKNQED